MIREVVDIVNKLLGFKMEYVHWICPLSFTIDREISSCLVCKWLEAPSSSSSQIFQKLSLCTVLLVQLVYAQLLSMMIVLGIYVLKHGLVMFIN